MRLCLHADLFVSGVVGGVCHESPISHPCVMSRLVARFDVHYPTFALSVGLGRADVGYYRSLRTVRIRKDNTIEMLAGLERASERIHPVR